MLAYLRYDEEHPHGAWAAYVGMGRSDPVLRGIEDIDNDRQADRILARINDAVGDQLDSKVERDLRIIVYGWLAFTFEMCRQRLIDPSIDAGHVADACAHALLDAVGRVPGIPDALAETVVARAPLTAISACRCTMGCFRAELAGCRQLARWLVSHRSPGPVQRADPRVVHGHVRRADPGAGAGVVGHRRRRQHAGHRADRLR